MNVMEKIHQGKETELGSGEMGYLERKVKEVPTEVVTFEKRPQGGEGGREACRYQGRRVPEPPESLSIGKSGL